MNNYDVSIIVPVYNVENYLEKCIKSLINQTCKNIEIILVDDGSTDSSGNLCDHYAEIDNFVIIHKNNAGLSSARNAGILVASGKYIMFVDSDDYIENDSCERLLREAQIHNCDIVAADAYILKDDGTMKANMKEKNIIVPCKGIEFLTHSINEKTMSMCAPYGMYSRKLIMSNSILFKNGILHEDELWTPQIYLLAQKVSYIPYKFYYHCLRENSITQSRWTSKRGEDIANICMELSKIYKKISCEKQYKILMNYLCSLYLNSLNMTKNKSGNKLFLKGAAYSKKNKLKSILYLISPTLYFAINPHKSN